MVVSLQKYMNGCLICLAPSGGRGPYILHLLGGDVLQKQNILKIYGYGSLSRKAWDWLLIWSCIYRREMSLCSATSRGRFFMEVKYSDYVWSWKSIFKSLGVIACFVLHLQEGDALISGTFRREMAYGNEIYMVM